mmetsp:Transcript_28606/g.52030  ORF Transcript_28606/g.52030 Transcript_28606/m.52030 type:complete len:322 (+) Transcript_28606:56-1021(+)
MAAKTLTMLECARKLAPQHWLDDGDAKWALRVAIHSQYRDQAKVVMSEACDMQPILVHSTTLDHDSCMRAMRLGLRLMTDLIHKKFFEHLQPKSPPTLHQMKEYLKRCIIHVFALPELTQPKPSAETMKWQTRDPSGDIQTTYHGLWCSCPIYPCGGDDEGWQLDSARELLLSFIILHELCHGFRKDLYEVLCSTSPAGLPGDTLAVTPTVPEYMTNFAGKPELGFAAEAWAMGQPHTAMQMVAVGLHEEPQLLITKANDRSVHYFKPDLSKLPVPRDLLQQPHDKTLVPLFDDVFWTSEHGWEELSQQAEQSMRRLRGCR